MKPKNLPLVVSISVALSAAVSAEIRTKAATGTDLSQPESWDVPPGADDIALWDASSLAGNQTLGQTQTTWSGIVHTNASAVTIQGGALQTLTLGPDGVDLSSTGGNLSLGTSGTMSFNIVLAADQTWKQAAGRQLGLNRTTDTFVNLGGFTVAVEGPATAPDASTFNNVNFNSALIRNGTLDVKSGTVSFANAGGGSLTTEDTLDVLVRPGGVVRLSASGPLTLNHSTTLLGGAMIFGAASPVLAGSLAVDAPSVIGTRPGTSSTPSISGVISGESRLTVDPADTTTINLGVTGNNPDFSGGWTLEENSTLTVNSGAALGTGTVTGTGTLAKNGTDTTLVLGANTAAFQGRVILNSGTIALDADDALGDGPFSFAFVGSGNSVMRSADATARVVPNEVDYGRNSVLGSADTGDLLFTGEIKTGGLAKTFTILNSITEFRGPVSSTGSTERVKAGPGRLIFSADNSYTGATRIAEGVLQVGTGGDAGTLGGGSVVNNGTLEINRSGFLSISGVISGSGTLIHSGPGETILSLAQTYTGDTVITNGTLSPTFLTFDDASAIFISGSGKLDLFEESTDLIADLYLDGERQEAGLYGAPGAKVAYGDPDIIETPFLTGAGLLEVRAAGSAYEEWVAQFTFENEGDDDPDVDANGNGINNRGEFALDGDPVSGASSGKVAGRSADGVFTLTLPVRKNAGAFINLPGGELVSAEVDGVIYRIQASVDLADWDLQVTEVTPALTSGMPAVSDPDGWEYRSFRIPDGHPAAFIRAVVDGPEN